MIDKILLGVAADGESDASLKLAAELATSNDAELVVLQLEPLVDARQMFDPEGVPGRASSTRRLGRDYPGLRLRTVEARGYALRSVCDVAEDERPDLIVVSHGRAGRGNSLLSRRASKALVERAPCAVLLVAS